MLTNTISGLFKDATAAVAANPEGGFDQILASMAGGLKARVASLPIVGDIAIGIINLINAAADQVDRDTDAMLQRQEIRNADAMRRVQEKEAGARAAFDASEAAENPQQKLQESIRRINQEKQAAIAAFQERTAKELEANKIQGDADNKGMIDKEEQQRAIDERERAIKAEIAHQEELAQKRIATARQTAAREQQAIDEDIADKKQAAIEKAQQAAEKAEHEAARAAEEAAKDAADAKIEQIERAADARSDAIDRELAEMQKVSDAADERSALMQQGGANLVDSINTAFGAFKVAQPGAQQELVTSVNKQIALNERIAALQAEQKRIADETKRSIDEIRMSLKGTVR
jgi:colicin import membrane protein